MSSSPGCQILASELARQHSIHVSTIHRWIQRGVKGVKLEAFRRGGRWVVTQEALNRFFSELTRPTKAHFSDTSAAPSAAEKQLAKLGM